MIALASIFRLFNQISTAWLTFKAVHEIRDFTFNISHQNAYRAHAKITSHIGRCLCQRFAFFQSQVSLQAQHVSCYRSRRKALTSFAKTSNNNQPPSSAESKTEKRLQSLQHFKCKCIYCYQNIYLGSFVKPYFMSSSSHAAITNGRSSLGRTLTQSISPTMLTLSRHTNHTKIAIQLVVQKPHL